MPLHEDFEEEQHFMIDVGLKKAGRLDKLKQHIQEETNYKGKINFENEASAKINLQFSRNTFFYSIFNDLLGSKIALQDLNGQLSLREQLKESLRRYKQQCKTQVKPTSSAICYFSKN